MLEMYSREPLVAGKRYRSIAETHLGVDFLKQVGKSGWPDIAQVVVRRLSKARDCEALAKKGGTTLSTSFGHINQRAFFVVKHNDWLRSRQSSC